MSKRVKRFVGLAVVAGAVTVGSVATAAWLATGTGSGNAKATSAIALTTVDASADTSAQLYPGGTGDLKIRITNPNPYPVEVNNIDGNGAITADAAHPACVITGVTYDDTVGVWDVPAGATVLFTLPGTVHMSNASDNGCQGATFTVPVSLAGHSDA